MHAPGRSCRPRQYFTRGVIVGIDDEERSAGGQVGEYVGDGRGDGVALLYARVMKYVDGVVRVGQRGVACVVFSDLSLDLTGEGSGSSRAIFALAEVGVGNKDVGGGGAVRSNGGAVGIFAVSGVGGDQGRSVVWLGGRDGGAEVDN